jgi:hypothetical protein
MTTLIKTNAGVEYPAIFNNSVLLKLASSEDIPTGQYLVFLATMSKWSMARTLKLYRLMLIVGGLLDNKPFTIPLDEFEDWLYVYNPELIDQLTMVFAQSLPDLLPGEDKGEKKKKLTTTK